MILTDFNWSSCICDVTESHTKSVISFVFVCKRCIWCSVLINIRCAPDVNKYSKPSADWSVHSIAAPRRFYISFKKCEIELQRLLLCAFCEKVITITDVHNQSRHYAVPVHTYRRTEAVFVIADDRISTIYLTRHQYFSFWKYLHQNDSVFDA